MSLQNIFFQLDTMTIEKAHGKKDAKPQNFKIKGLASTNSKDGDGEILDPKGFILDRFKYINYNHSKEPKDVIGEITKATVTKNGLEVEGILYADNPLSKQVYDTALNMDSAGNGMKWGLSVEGRTIEASEKGKTIKKAELFGMAVCLVPVNGDTFVDIYKSFFGKEQNIQKTSIMEKNELTALDISKAYAEASKKMGAKAMNGMDGEKMKDGEDDDEGNDDGEVEIEIKKSILHLHGLGRTVDKIQNVVTDYFDKSVTQTQIERVIAEANDPKAKALDIVKSHFDNLEAKIVETQKGLGTMVDAVMKRLDGLEKTVDKFGLGSQLAKSDIEKSIKASPYDGKGGSKKLYLTNPRDKEIIKGMVIEVFGDASSQAVDVEASSYLKAHDRERLKEAKGVEIV